jgi:hypothetical protein
VAVEAAAITTAATTTTTTTTTAPTSAAAVPRAKSGHFGAFRRARATGKGPPPPSWVPLK